MATDPAVVSGAIEQQNTQQTSEFLQALNSIVNVTPKPREAQHNQAVQTEFNIVPSTRSRTGVKNSLVTYLLSLGANLRDPLIFIHKNIRKLKFK